MRFVEAFWQGYGHDYCSSTGDSLSVRARPKADLLVPENSYLRDSWGWEGGDTPVLCGKWGVGVGVGSRG